MTKIVLMYKKIDSNDKTKYENSYLRLKPEIIINESYIDDLFQSIYTIY